MLGEVERPAIEQLKLFEWLLFADRISHFPQDERDNIEFAYKSSELAHSIQTRKTGERFFTHPRASALILLDVGVTNWRVIVCALLHDVAEDTEAFGYQDEKKLVDWDKVRRLFVDNQIQKILEEITQGEIGQSKKQSDRTYFSQIRNASEETILIKMADRLHNLSTMQNMTPDKISQKIKETKKYYPTFKKTFRKYPASGKILFERIQEKVHELEAA